MVYRFHRILSTSLELGQKNSIVVSVTENPFREQFNLFYNLCESESICKKTSEIVKS